MPLTPQQKQKLLSFQGLDNTSWEVQENPDGSTQAIPRQSPIQPSASPDGTAGLVSAANSQREQETTATQAALHHLATSAIPTAAGMGGGVLAGMGLGALSGSVVPGIGTFLGGLAGAIGASYGASKLQDQFLSDKFKQQLALEQQQHPVASFAGEVAPSMAFFNPVTSLKNLPTLVSGLKGLAKVNPGEYLPNVLATGSKALSTAEREVLKNAAINAGVGGGQELASQMSSEEPMNYGRLAGTVGLGALLNEPTKLGRLMGFHGMPQEAKVIAKPVIPKPEPLPHEFENEAGPIPYTATDDKGKYLVPDKTVHEVFNREYPDYTRPSTVSGEGVSEPNTRVGLTPEQKREFLLQKQIEKTGGDQPESKFAEPNSVHPAVKEMIAVHQQKIDSLQTQLEEQGKMLKASMDSQQKAIAPAVEVKPPDTVAPGERQLSETSHVTEAEMNELEAGKVPITLDRLPPIFKKHLIDLYKERATTRGQTLEVKPAAEVVDTAGTQVAGYHGGRANVLSDTKAGPDTAPHEIGGHGMVNDLLGSSDPADVKLAKKGLDIFKAGTDPKEELAIAFGKAMVGRDVTGLYGTKSAKFKAYLDDVKAHFKVKFGLANDADVMRHLNRRFESDAPFGKNTELLTEANMKSSSGQQQQNQEAQPQPKEAPATYLGYQEGFGKVPGTHLYNLHEDLSPTLVKGSTVSRKAIEAAGYSIPKVEAAKETIPEVRQYATRSQTKPDDIKLGAYTDELKTTAKEQSPLPYLTMPGTRSQNDVIRLKGGISGNIAADAMEKYRPAVREIEASYRNPIRDVLTKLHPDESTRLEQILHAENKAGKSFAEYTNTPRMEEAYKTSREILRKMQQDQIDAKQPVTEWDSNGKPSLREAKINEFYFPNRLSPLVMKVLGEKPNSELGLRLKNDYLKLQKESGITDANALTKWDSLLAGIDKSQPNMTRFNAVRKAEGTGLPDSFQQPGLLKNLESYIHRTALDRAYYTHIENVPDAATAFGHKTDPWGKAWEAGKVSAGVAPAGGDEVRNLKERLAGEHFDAGERTLKSFGRLATSAMLGPLTNIHIAASSLANALTHQAPGELVKAVTHMVGGWKEANTHAVENGYIKHDSRGLHDLLDAHADLSDKIGTMSSFIGKVNGRNLTDSVTKTALQAIGEFTVRSKSARAALGNKTDDAYMKHLDKSYTPGKTYSPEEVSKLGSVFAEYLHGAHDERTQPSWMLKDSAIQPFFSLMSWNIAQTNHFMKHVWTPATRGDYTPLIMSTLGSLVGGYVIKELREGLAGHGNSIPGFKELVESDRGLKGNIPLAAYNAMAMAQICGFAGILSTAAKDIFDVAHKNIPQGATFPLVEITGNVAKTLSQGVSALVEGDTDITTLAPRLAKDLLQENVQMARIAISWAAKSGAMPEEARKNEVTTGARDIRNWKMAEGQDYNEQTSSENNPYINLDRQKFKRTSDIGEAADMLPGLISKAFDKAKGDPYKLKEQLKALRQNEFPTMPSLQEAPISFMSYLMFLEKTQGKDAAQERLSRYMEQNAINSVKKGMVPSL